MNIKENTSINCPTSLRSKRSDDECAKLRIGVVHNEELRYCVGGDLSTSNPQSSSGGLPQTPGLDSVLLNTPLPSDPQRPELTNYALATVKQVAPNVYVITPARSNNLGK
jgi:hypothetical protein